MKNETKIMVLLGVFVAIIIILGMTPIGLIPLGFINLTIVHIPVIVGTLLLGMKRGVILGAAFGIVSTLAAFGMSLAAQSGLAATLLGYSPLAVIALCMVPRICIPLVCGAVYKLVYRIANSAKNETTRKMVATGVAAFCGSLTNTVLYLGIMGTFYKIYGIWGNFAKILGVMIAVGAICEAIAATVIAIPVVRVLGDKVNND